MMKRRGLERPELAAELVEALERLTPHQVATAKPVLVELDLLELVLLLTALAESRIVPWDALTTRIVRDKLADALDAGRARLAVHSDGTVDWP